MNNHEDATSVFAAKYDIDHSRHKTTLGMTKQVAIGNGNEDNIDGSSGYSYDKEEENMDMECDMMKDNCWKCNWCDGINNIKLTMDTDDMRCIRCKTGIYFPWNAETLMASKWMTKNNSICLGFI